jgi:hypothetical protein
MNNDRYQKLTRRMAHHIADACIATGCTVSLDNGGMEDGDGFAIQTKDASALKKEMWATDEERLIMHDANGKCVGWIFLVYGNDPWELVSDYSDNPATEALMEGVNAYSEKMERDEG